jgi:hypothetical protein
MTNTVSVASAHALRRFANRAPLEAPIKVSHNFPA